MYYSPNEITGLFNEFEQSPCSAEQQHEALEITAVEELRNEGTCFYEDKDELRFK